MTQQEFLDKYGIKTTFEEMSKFSAKAKAQNTDKTVEQMRYIQGLNFMFTKFIDSQTNLEEFDTNQTLWDIDLAQFTIDFEDVMTNDPLQRDIGRKRKPYEGAELDAIDSLKETAEEYSEKLEDVLALRIKRGADLGEFRKSTLVDLKYADYNENAKNVSTMYLTMKKVIDERTWKDRINPLNWWRIINENVFMIQINSRMNDITRKELKSGSTQFGSSNRRHMSGKNFEIEKESYAKSKAYMSIVIPYDRITELENYKNARGEEIPNEVDLETTVIGRTHVSVIEASPDLDKTIDVQELYQNAPNKDHDKSIDSM